MMRCGQPSFLHDRLFRTSGRSLGIRGENQEGWVPAMEPRDPWKVMAGPSLDLHSRGRKSRI